MITTMGDLKVYKVSTILRDLEISISSKEPFSLIRFGDGGIKLLHSIYYNDDEQLSLIIEREGLPSNKIIEVLELWGRYSRDANYIDTLDVYFSRKFWGKYRKGNKAISKKTVQRMEMWRDLYSRAEFDNYKYCNPEINYLMCLRMRKKRNLIDILRGKRICIISTFSEFKDKLKVFDLTPIQIVGHFENQYQKSFDKVIKFINSSANMFDIWLIAAGELGRIYTGLIKEKGGRAIDIGFVIDYWQTGYVPDRIEKFVQPNPKNDLEFVLTKHGRRYENYL